MTPRAKLRRLWWRRVRRHRGELCHSCGHAVALSCPSYWTAPDDLWQHVEGGEGGIRCIPCFTADAEREGVTVAWQAVVA